MISNLSVSSNMTAAFSTTDPASHMAKNIDDLFLVIMGSLIYVMQPGFAFLEAGSVRSKNTTNSLFRNFVGSMIACVAYWLCGYAFAFGDLSNSFIGYSNFAAHSITKRRLSFWFFEFMFAAAATSIMSGAIAERSDIISYLVYSTVVPGFIYPVVTHWTWDTNGWLAVLKLGSYSGGFQDFAGSGGVHVCGATCALAGALMLGPRASKTTNDFNMEETRGHSVPLMTLGSYLLLFAFFGFNAGSQFHISHPGDGEFVARAAATTILSGSCGGLGSLLSVRLIQKRWSLLHSINGCLAGMVAICASCNNVHLWGAIIIGLMAGLIYFPLSILVPKLGIDDPVDTVALHLGGGSWGVIAAAFFDIDHGIILHWAVSSAFGLVVQLIGLSVIFAWSFSLTCVMFGTLRLLRLHRVAENVELNGLDSEMHFEPAYSMEPTITFVTKL